MRFLLLTIWLWTLTALAQMPSYQRNPITTNGPTAMTNEVREAINWSALIDTNGIFVDSVGGSDANAGSYLFPYKTIAKVMASDLTGKTVWLKRGSIWREQLSITTANTRVMAYGIGDRPLLDCSDVIPSGTWTKTVGQTVVYQADVTIAADVSVTWVSAWEDSVRMTRATSIANCDATANSYYPSADVGAGMITITLYVHASDDSNPASSGKTYEYSARQFGVESFNASSPVISGIWTRRNLYNDGSLRLGIAGRMTNVLCSEGTKHNALVRRDVYVKDSEFSDAYYTPSGSSMVVAFDTFYNTNLTTFDGCSSRITQPSLAGAGQTCGISSHGVSYIQTLLVKNCIMDGCSFGFDFQNVITSRLDQVTVTNANYRGLQSYVSNVIITGSSIRTTGTGRPMGFETVAALVKITNSVIASGLVAGGNTIWVLVPGSRVEINSSTVIGNDNAVVALTDLNLFARSNSFAVGSSGSFFYATGNTNIDSDFNTFMAPYTGNRFHFGASDYTLNQYRALNNQDLHSLPGASISGTNVFLDAPQWIDVQLNYAYSVTGPSAPSLTVTTNSGPIQVLAFDNGDMLYGNLQLPHNIAVTNALFPKWHWNPHIHWSTVGTLDSTHSNVTWRIEWEIANINGLWNVRGTNSLTKGVTNNFTHYVSSLGPITNDPPPGISAVFRCRLMRPASVAQDYSNAHDVLFDGMDIHIPVGNKTIVGSREEFSQ